jgi:threonine synthase
MHYIKQAFDAGYLMDPHTATCFKSCRAPAFADRVNIIYSTAEWTKFAPIIDQAINGNRGQADRSALEAIAASANVEVPPMIASLFEKPVAHPDVVARQDIEAEILKFLET